jgi:uncharacterized protein (TIGR00725 family)
MTRSKNQRKVIAIVGNASESSSPAVLLLARTIGQGIVDAGFVLVTGGLGGVMRAASQGARLSAQCGDGSVLGILPSYDRTTANEFVQIAIPTGMQLARNTLVVAMADVVIAIGGGSGTLSEMAIAWQLGKPIVAVTECGGWSGELAGRTLDSRGAVPVHTACDAAEAVALTIGLATTARPEAGEINSQWRGGQS